MSSYLTQHWIVFFILCFVWLACGVLTAVVVSKFFSWLKEFEDDEWPDGF